MLQPEFVLSDEYVVRYNFLCSEEDSCCVCVCVAGHHLPTVSGDIGIVCVPDVAHAGLGKHLLCVLARFPCGVLVLLKHTRRVCRWRPFLNTGKAQNHDLSNALGRTRHVCSVCRRNRDGTRKSVVLFPRTVYDVSLFVSANRTKNTFRTVLVAFFFLITLAVLFAYPNGAVWVLTGSGGLENNVNCRIYH